MIETKLYIYEGPVSQFGKIIEDFWRGGTQAVSKIKAIVNLQYQYKKKNKLAVDCKIELDPTCIKLSDI